MTYDEKEAYTQGWNEGQQALKNETVVWRGAIYTAVGFGILGLTLLGWRATSCQETVWENRTLTYDLRDAQVVMAVMEYDLNRMHHE